MKLGSRTLIMGILNVTPDSFSDDGCWPAGNKGRLPLLQAQKLMRHGADIIDIGGESSRPGAKPVTANEEIQRILPVIQKLKPKTAIPISVDTYKPSVAWAVLDAGAEVINYIHGANPDPKMLHIVSKFKAGIILMHMQGTPRTMQKRPKYTNIIQEIYKKLQKSVEICLEFGIKSDKIILDPGIGFGKTVEHNLQILNHLKEFQPLKKPILIGTSRKSFIGKILNQEPRNRLNGSLGSVCAAIGNGAHIARVHDVKETRDAIRIMDAIINEHPPTENDDKLISQKNNSLRTRQHNGEKPRNTTS